MAEQKILNARLCQKIDTEENWNKAVNFIPLKGEIIVYTDNDGKNERVKIGDGITKVGDLDFIKSYLTYKYPSPEGDDFIVIFDEKAYDTYQISFNFIPSYNIETQPFTIIANIDGNEK
jgi:hypothetical protein